MGEWQHVVQGDIEAAVIKILSEDEFLSDFSGGAPTVSSTLVGWSMRQRWIMVSREGGNISWPKIDRPRVDFNVFAETRTVALQLAQYAQAAVFAAMDSAHPDFGVRLTDAKVETGIFRAPDKETGSPRYVFALRLTCVPYST